MNDRDRTSDLDLEDPDAGESDSDYEAQWRFEARMHALSLAIAGGCKGDAAMAQAERYLAWGEEQPAGIH